MDTGTTPPTDPRGRQNDPPLLIMLSLAEGDKHGHALVGDIERIAGVRLGPGTLYGAITRLEDRGLIEPLAKEGRRQPYRLTGEGLRALGEEVAELRRLADAGEQRIAVAARRTALGSFTPRWTP